MEESTNEEPLAVPEIVNNACETASNACDDVDLNDVSLPPPLPVKRVIHLKSHKDPLDPPADGHLDDDPKETAEEELEEMDVEEDKITTARAPIVFGKKSTTRVTMQLSLDNGADQKKLNFNVMLASPMPYSNKHKKNGKVQFAMAKKLSTISLAASVEKDQQDRVKAEVDQSLIQRRNSIHNVPYVDVNDPQTRARMERYKEERRNMLRAKYKVEDYFVEKLLDQPEVPKPEPVVLRKTPARPKSMSAAANVRNDVGLIDEDVNVKERAAIFKSKSEEPPAWLRGRISAPVLNSKSDSACVGRKLSVGNSTSPSKIKNIAAFFEQKT